jgi:MraZ protein
VGVFRGVTSLNLDAKGRMAIPARYRELLQSSCNAQLVVTADKDRCLLLYPAPEWLVIEERLRNLPTFNEQTRNLQRLYIGHAQDVEMDAQGRILLSAELRSFASLERRVALVGQGRRFEVWDEETWNRKRDEWLDRVDLGQMQLPAELGSLSI